MHRMINVNHRKRKIEDVWFYKMFYVFTLFLTFRTLRGFKSPLYSCRFSYLNRMQIYDWLELKVVSPINRKVHFSSTFWFTTKEESKNKNWQLSWFACIWWFGLSGYIASKCDCVQEYYSDLKVIEHVNITKYKLKTLVTLASNTSQVIISKTFTSNSDIFVNDVKST